MQFPLVNCSGIYVVTMWHINKLERQFTLQCCFIILNKWPWLWITSQSVVSKREPASLSTKPCNILYLSVDKYCLLLFTCSYCYYQFSIVLGLSACVNAFVCNWFITLCPSWMVKVFFSFKYLSIYLSIWNRNAKKSFPPAWSVKRKQHVVDLLVTEEKDKEL